MAAYRRLSAAGDIKASHKLAALTGAGERAMKGTLESRIYWHLFDTNRKQNVNFDVNVNVYVNVNVEFNDI